MSGRESAQTAPRPSPEVREYHVVAEVHWAPRPGCGENAPPPRRTAVTIEAYSAEDAIVQAEFLLKLPAWLYGTGVTPAYGEPEVARVVVLHVHPLQPGCSGCCVGKWTL